MLQATVVGHVWATKRIDGLPNGAFLEVEVEGSGDRLVAFDVLGSGHGERVLIAQGSVASGWLIIGSIDEPTASPPTGRVTKTGSASAGQPRGSRHSGRPKTSR